MMLLPKSSKIQPTIQRCSQIHEFRVDHLALVSSQRVSSWRRLYILLLGASSSLSRDGTTREFLHPHQDINWCRHCAGLVQTFMLLRFHGAAPCHIHKRQHLTADVKFSVLTVFITILWSCSTNQSISEHPTVSCSNFKKTVEQEERGQGGVNLEKASEKGNV